MHNLSGLKQCDLFPKGFGSQCLRDISLGLKDEIDRSWILGEALDGVYLILDTTCPARVLTSSSNLKAQKGRSSEPHIIPLSPLPLSSIFSEGGYYNGLPLVIQNIMESMKK